MKVYLSERRTFEGFTYQSGLHEVDKHTGEKMLHNFPRVCVARVNDDVVAVEYEIRPEVIMPQADKVEYTVTTDDADTELFFTDEKPAIDDEPAAPPSEPENESTPQAQALADELGIDLTGVVGTGNDGKILVRDVRKAVWS